MQSIATYQTVVVWGFSLFVASAIILGMLVGLKRISEVFLLVPAICFGVFLFAAAKRDMAVEANLEKLDCEYIGSGEKGPSHIPARKYYKCPDGIIRGN